MSYVEIQLWGEDEEEAPKKALETKQTEPTHSYPELVLEIVPVSPKRKVQKKPN